MAAARGSKSVLTTSGVLLIWETAAEGTVAGKTRERLKDLGYRYSWPSVLNQVSVLTFKITDTQSIIEQTLGKLWAL